MNVRFLELFALNRASRVEWIPTFPAGATIPPFIHQTFHSEPWPDEIRANIDKIKRLNPTWSHRFYDYEARRVFIKKHYGDRVLALYDSVNVEYGAARADLFRYLLMYKEGGVYLDMKSSTDRSLSEVIRSDDVYLLSNWQHGPDDPFKGWGQHSEVTNLRYGELQQWFIAAAPGHPFLKQVIERVLRNISVYMYSLHSYGSYAVFRVTGPVAYSLAIEPLLAHCNYRFVDSKKDLGLVYSVYQDARFHTKTKSHYSHLRSALVVADRKRRFFDAFIGVLKAFYIYARRGRRYRGQAALGS